MVGRDLEIFNQMPFLFWAKDASGKYVWGNREIDQLAGESVVGKTDRELIWADNADALQADDKLVFESGEPLFRREYVDKSKQGGTTLNACKWLGELDGKRRCFGISFTIPE